MIILQIIMALGSVGIIGFILYWAGLALHGGLGVTREEVDNDPRV
jgi:hypothetical protein